MLGILMKRLFGRRPTVDEAFGARVPLAPPLARMMRLPVFYDAAMNAPRLNSPSHGPEKAGLVMQSWSALPVPLEVRPFAAVDPTALTAVHDPEHVRALLAGERMNGYNNTSAAVAQAELWKVGSLVAAATHAARERCVALSPSCGFHHAHHRMAMDFCTFNGLLLAAHRLVEQGLARRVALLDLDRHFGDGTQDILERTPALEAQVAHYSFSALALGKMGVNSPRSAERWLSRLAEDIAVLREQGCDVVLYNPGNDPHVDDPMGGFLTDEQMRRRDRIVFQTCRDLGLPVAVTLGGGYRRPYRLVLDGYDATLFECWAAFGDPPPAALPEPAVTEADGPAGEPAAAD